MTFGFYRALEDRYRGDRNLIKSRLRVYLPFVEPLKKAYPKASVLDLGCGRGEWLELLQENGIDSLGVDLDEGMLEACQQIGLHVKRENAIDFLQSLPDNSHSVISGFHLAEHLDFADLQALVKESLRVLKPCGLLVLETPNPENLVVASSNFYLDPTHQKPLPPELLAFLPEYYGFKRVKTLRLQEPKEIDSDKDLSLLDVFNGVSLDYAIIAQKYADAKLLTDDCLMLVDEAFSKGYGITLEAVATRYHQQMVRRLDALEAATTRYDASEESSQSLEATNQSLKATNRSLKAANRSLEAANRSLEATNRSLEATNWSLDMSMSELVNSRSWQVAQFLRSSVRCIKVGVNRFHQFPKRFFTSTKQMFKRVFIRIASSVLKQPWLKSFLMKFLERSPKLRYRLRLLVYTGNTTGLMRSPRELSPLTAKVLSDLKQAMGKK